MSVNTAEKIASELTSFIRENFQVPQDDDYFSGDINLWEEGYIDSIGVVEVIAHLEQTFDVQIPEEVVFSPEFASIRGIAKLVAQLQQGGAP